MPHISAVGVIESAYYFYMIRTDRLTLSPLTPSDAISFFALTEDEGFGLYPITVYRQKDLATARIWLKRNEELFQQTQLGKFAIRELGFPDSLIGMGGLTPWDHRGRKEVDLTYRLRGSAWGQGFATESAKALLEYGFGKLELESITATITPDNQASKKIAEKLGLSLEEKINLLGVPTEVFRLRREDHLKLSLKT